MTPYPMYRATEEVVYGILQTQDGHWLAGRLEDTSLSGQRMFIESIEQARRNSSGCTVEASTGNGIVMGQLTVRDGRDGGPSTWNFSCSL